MRMVRNVVMAMAVLASATMANAASFVWYTATGNNAQSTAAAGGQGQALNLSCDTSGAPGSCSWNVSMLLGAGNVDGLLGWSADLRTAAGNGVATSAPNVIAGPFTGGLTASGTPGTGASLLQGSGAFGFTPVTPQTLTVLTFTLTRSYNTGDLSVANVIAGSSTSEQLVWADANGNFESVGFGANPATDALPGTFGALPSIVITNVPEPTSLGLLALGALAVIRRRVAR